MDAQQFRFPSLAPRVERGLPWSLPRPFCLSPGFSFPVDPYRTGEFLLAVSVTPRQSLAAVLHTLRRFTFPKGVFLLAEFYELAMSQYMRTSLAAMTSIWIELNLTGAVAAIQSVWTAVDVRASSILLIPLVTQVKAIQRWA